MSLVDQYLAANRGHRGIAAASMARALMADDPATFKQGWPLEGALIAVQEQFGLTADELVFVRSLVEANLERNR